VIIIANREGEVIDINKSGLDLFGYTKEEMMELGILNIYVNPEDRKKIIEEVDEKGFVKDFEISTQKKDGTIMWCLLSSTSKRAEDGKSIEFQSIVRDITQEKIMQQQLIQSEKLSSIGTFVSGIAHELNNPLTVIGGWSHRLLKKESFSPEVQNILKMINEASERTVSIVRNLLKFSRKYQPDKEKIRIKDVLESTMSLQEYHMKVDNIEIKKDYSKNFSYVNANINQLQQIFMNIIINAMHSMKKSKAKKLFTVKAETRDNTVLVTFENNGPLIPIDKIGKVFDPFFTTKKQGEGTGLGLYVSYGIVNDHGGTIRVENIADSGVRFTVSLPVVTPTKKEKETGPQDFLTTDKGIRLLHVEDEKEIRLWMDELLSDNNISVFEASDAHEAIQAIKKNKFDVILADVKMPGMTGIELGEWIQQEYPAYGNKFVITTGVVDAEIEAAYKKYNWKCVMKPYDESELLDIIQSVVEK